MWALWKRFLEIRRQRKRKKRLGALEPRRQGRSSALSRRACAFP